MTTSTIYPSGVDSATDHATFDAAMAAANDGDTIIMSEQLSGGGAQNWLAGATASGTDRDVYLARDGVPIGSTFSMKPSSEAIGASQLLTKLFKIDKAVTVKGVVDGGGAPITIVEHDEAGLGATPSHSPFVQYNKFSTLENLRFANAGGECAVVQLHPSRVKNIILDQVDTGAIIPWIDNRVTYAGYASLDFSNPYLSYIEDVNQISGRSGFSITGSSGVIVDNMTMTAATNWYTAIVVVAGKAWGLLPAPTGWAGNVDLSYAMDCVVKNSVATGPSSGLGYSGAFNGTIRRNLFFNCTLENDNLSNFSYGAWAWMVNYYPEYGIPVWDDNHFVGCTMTNFFYPFWAGGGPGLITENGVIGDCTFVRNAGSRGPYSEMLIYDAQGWLFDKNDYTATQAPGIAANGLSMEGTMWLDPSTSYCTIHDNGGYPVGLGGAENFVTDLGFENRVVGLPAVNKIETPKGIGQVAKAAADTQMRLLPS